MLEHDKQSNYLAISGYEIVDKKAIFDSVEQIMILFEEKAAPFIRSVDCSFITQCRKIRFEPAKSLKCARLVAKKDHFLLSISLQIYEQKDPRHFRTLLSHEIGHTFFYEIRQDSIRRLLDADSLFPFNLHDATAMIIEDIASEIGRHLLIPDSYINQHIERKPSVLSLINVIERCIVEPSIAAQRLITDIFDFDSGLSYWVNCCVVIEDDTGSREIIGELPIDIPFLTQNDKLDKIVSLSPDFFDIQYGDYSNQKLSLIIAKPSP